MKENSPVAPFLATRPLYRKQNYFYGQPDGSDLTSNPRLIFQINCVLSQLHDLLCFTHLMT